MRHLLVLAAILAGAAPAAALAASDRYGDARGASQDSAPAFRTLGWANKTDSLQAPQSGPGYVTPEPMALAGQYLRGRASGGSRLDGLPPPPGERRVAAAYATGYQPFTPQEPYRPVQPVPRPPAAADAPPPAPPGALPTSLYSPPPAGAAIGAPQQIAQAEPPPAPAPTAGVGEGSHLYSVHRSYGLSPDAIPASRGDNYVLIGPPDASLSGGPPAEDDNSSSDGQPF